MQNLERRETVDGDELDVVLSDETVEQSILLAEPCRAAFEENWNALEHFYVQHEDLILKPISVYNDTVVHLLVHRGPKDLFDRLIKNLSLEDLIKKKNKLGNTVLSEVAKTNRVDLAEALLDRFAGCNILEIGNEKGETPLFIAASCGKIKMVKLLASKVRSMAPHLQRKDSVGILHNAILQKRFEAALELIKLEGVDRQLTDKGGMTCLQLLANMPLAFKSRNRFGIIRGMVYSCLPHERWEKHPTKEKRVRKDLEAGTDEHAPIEIKLMSTTIAKVFSKINWTFWHWLAKDWATVKELWKAKNNHDSALQLIKILVKTDRSWKKHPSDHCAENHDDHLKQKEDSRKANDIPLLAATRNGIIEIVKAILEEYPQAIEYVNQQQVNALHLAVQNRRDKIFDYILLSFKTQLPRLIRILDSNGNSLLHQTAQCEDYHKGNHTRPGEALHLQWEIQWFERVKWILPPQYINRRNNNGLTAEEWFEKNHTELVKTGQEWLRRTAESCTVVAALIATVAFTSAYTLPGGNEKSSGKPIFLNDQTFLVFTASDALSLSFSLTSLVIFLSIVTAPFHHRDFHFSLPLRLVFGLTSLFLAVASMMVAFASTLILLFKEYMHLAALPLYFLACYPVTIFLILQFPLYVKLTWYTIDDVVMSVKHSFLPPQVAAASPSDVVKVEKKVEKPTEEDQT